MAMDTQKEKIKDALIRGLAQLANRHFPYGKQEGNKYFVGDVHGSRGRSLTIDLGTGLWHDFATDEGGDIFALCGIWSGLSPRAEFTKLMQWCAKEVGVTWEAKKTPWENYKKTRGQTNTKERGNENPHTDKDTPPAQESQEAVKKDKPEKTRSVIGKVYFIYHTAGGKDWIRVTRATYDDGSKAFYPFDLIAGKRGLPTTNRPLYNLPGLAEAPVVVVAEGEKAADALNKQGITATTLVSGSNTKIDKTDLSPLTGKTVHIWPDADTPGKKYALRLARALKDIAGELLLLDVDGFEEQYKKGFDAADVAEQDKLRDWLPGGAIDNPWKPLEEFEPPEKKEETAPPKEEEDLQGVLDAMEWEPPFIPLGKQGNQYVLISSAGTMGTILTLPANAKTLKGYLEIVATQREWIEAGAVNEKGNKWHPGIALQMVINECQCRVYDPTSPMGTGCWKIKDAYVINNPSELIVTPPDAPLPARLPFVGCPQTIDLAEEAATAEEARGILEHLKSVIFHHPQDGYHVTAWSFMAVFCACLPARPSLVIEGASGKGKTTLVDHYIIPLLGKSVTQHQGGATEAGIRNLIGYSALPSLIDEFQQKTPQDAIRVENIYSLVRASYSSEGIIVKSNANQGVNMTVARSQYCFLGVAVPPGRAEDQNRRINLEILGHTDDDKPPHLEDFPKLTAKIRRRTFNRLPIILGEIFPKMAEQIKRLTKGSPLESRQRLTLALELSFLLGGLTDLKECDIMQPSGEHKELIEDWRAMLANSCRVSIDSLDDTYLRILLSQQLRTGDGAGTEPVRRLVFQAAGVRYRNPQAVGESDATGKGIDNRQPYFDKTAMVKQSNEILRTGGTAVCIICGRPYWCHPLCDHRIDKYIMEAGGQGGYAYARVLRQSPLAFTDAKGNLPLAKVHGTPVRVVAIDVLKLAEIYEIPDEKEAKASAFKYTPDEQS